MNPIRVGLVADPAAPTKIARRMSDLSPRDGYDRDAWDTEVVSEPFTIGSEDIDTAVARLQDQARQHNWDLVVGLTELPLHDDDGHYLLVEADPQRRTAVLSLPALGGLRMHTRTHAAVRELVSDMADPTTEGSIACLCLVAVVAGGCSRDGARQSPLVARARAQVRARRGIGNGSHRHDQLHGLAAGRLVVLVASRGCDDRLGRARRRLARDRRRTLGPPRRELR